jgi:hypothetical protein
LFKRDEQSCIQRFDKVKKSIHNISTTSGMNLQNFIGKIASMDALTG